VFFVRVADDRRGPLEQTRASIILPTKHTNDAKREKCQLIYKIERIRAPLRQKPGTYRCSFSEIFVSFRVFRGPGNTWLRLAITYCQWHPFRDRLRRRDVAAQSHHHFHVDRADVNAANLSLVAFSRFHLQPSGVPDYNAQCLSSSSSPSPPLRSRWPRHHRGVVSRATDNNTSKTSTV